MATAKKLSPQAFLGEISALAESIRAETLHDPKDTLSFRDWCNVVSPNYRWDWAHLAYIRARVQPRIDALACALQGDYSPDYTPRHLILSVPPRHGKSEQVTVRLPAYLLERYPSMRLIVGAYNATLAKKFSRKTRRIAAGRVALMTDSNSVEDWETAQEGGYRAVGVGGGVTGMGANCIIIDDPVKSREEAESATYREKVWEWFTDDIYTRLEPGGVVILIMTRWHDDDLAGRIQKSDFAHDFEVINLPAEAEYGDVLGRQVGEALCSDRFNELALARLKVVLGRSYNSLYQGRPTAAEGDIIQLTWMQRYSQKPTFKRVTQSWDTAQKAGANNDYNVCATFGEDAAGNYYLLDVFRDRLEYPALKRAAIELRSRFNPTELLIEDKGHGTALGQELKTLPNFRVIMIEPEGDKITRMSIESTAIEAGRLFLPESAPWLPDFEQECQHFPRVAHDDQVDALSQYLCWQRKGSGNVIEFTPIPKHHFDDFFWNQNS